MSDSGYNALAAAVIRADNAAERFRRVCEKHRSEYPPTRPYKPTSTFEIVVGSYAIVLGGFAGLFMLARFAAYVAGN